MKKLKTDRRPDYVMVKLTPEGEAFAGTLLRITNRHLDYAFKPGEALEVVERYEWAQVLRPMRTPEGSPIFALADAPEILKEGVGSDAEQL